MRLPKLSSSHEFMIDDDNAHTKQNTFLTFKDCYFLSIAGCLLHFQIDHIFEENGRDKFYLWILSTGNFDTSTNTPLSISCIFFVSLCTLSLVIGFSWIHIIRNHQITNNNNSINKFSFHMKIKYTLLLFIIIIIIYFIFLVVSKYIFEFPAVVGEEADLGVLVYIMIFHFLPFYLCLQSISHD
jgi:hypothetical protein